MHSPLEEYLNEVSGRLGPLPVARRNEELREMRQHLLNAVIVNREFGQSETEAAENAVEQFGSPEELAARQIAVWRRGEIGKRRDFLGAMACTMVLSFIFPRALESLEDHTGFLRLLVPIGQPGFVRVAVSLTYVVHALAGGIAGLIFRKRAVAGTALAVIVWYGVPAFKALSGLEWVRNPALWAIEYTEFGSLAFLAAWAASQWRNRRTLQRNIAATSCQVSARG